MDREEQRVALVSGLDDPVRRRLYDYVFGVRRGCRREEAAAATGIGRPLAAYHLDRAGQPRPAGRRLPTTKRPDRTGAGRPAKVYVRSGSEFTVTVPPREYELAARLLAEAVE